MNKQVEKKDSGLTRRELVKSGLIVGGALIAGGVLLDSAGFRTARARALMVPPNGGLHYIEVFPTSPLILNPFRDDNPLPIPLPLKPSDPNTWGSAPDPKTGGTNDSRGGVHQLGCSQLGLPAPIYYRIPLQVGAHSFSTQKVLPIDSGGNPVTLPASWGVAQAADGTVTRLPDSTIYGFNGAFPGAMIKAKYGQPVLIRFVNELDDAHGLDRNDFGEETFLTHLHNGHTAPESDGNPNYSPMPYQVGEWCDNLYLNWPAAGDQREMQSTLWFHDHSHSHTGANVYKGMVGLYPIYDAKQDNGDETKGYRLPGVTSKDPARNGAVDYDIPLALYDTRLDDGVTQHQDFHNGNGETHPEWWGKTFFRHFPNHGFVGDVFTVNCKANPVLTVKRRRYRLRFLDASIARIYDLKLMASTKGPVAARETGRSGVKLQGQYQLPDGQQCMKMVQIASEGGLLPFPFLRDSVKVWPAKRREVIVDFSKYMDGTPTTKGDVIYLTNVLQMTNGRKPNDGLINYDEETGKPLPFPITDPDFDPDFRVPLMKIVIGDDAPDNSKDPLDYVNKDSNGTCTLKLDPTTQLPILGMRALPSLPRSFKGFASRTFELQRSGTFGGETEWLINGREFDETTPLAYPLQGAGELWIIKNGGGGWVHPMHLHEEEHRVISRNGVLAPTNAANPLLYNRTYRGQDHPDDIGKEDVVALDPGEEVVVWRKFRDFKGPYVAHCHNLAHEDHAMMFGWDIV